MILKRSLDGLLVTPHPPVCLPHPLSQLSPAHRRPHSVRIYIHAYTTGATDTLIQVWELSEGGHPWPYQEHDPARTECTQAKHTAGLNDELSRGNTDVGSLCLFHFSLSWGHDSDFPRTFPRYCRSKIMAGKFNVKVQRVSRGILHSDTYERRLWAASSAGRIVFPYLILCSWAWYKAFDIQYIYFTWRLCSHDRLSVIIFAFEDELLPTSIPAFFFPPAFRIYSIKSSLNGSFTLFNNFSVCLCLIHSGPNWTLSEISLMTSSQQLYSIVWLTPGERGWRSAINKLANWSIT